MESLIRKIIQVGPICNLCLYKLGTEGGLAQKRRQLDDRNRVQKDVSEDGGVATSQGIQAAQWRLKKTRISVSAQNLQVSRTGLSYSTSGTVRG